MSRTDFERDAIKLFRTKGLKETFRFEHSNGKQYFQYMVPLIMEQKCLKCHNRQEDALNSIGGGLSVFLPVDEMNSTTRKNHQKLAVAGTVLHHDNDSQPFCTDTTVCDQTA